MIRQAASRIGDNLFLACLERASTILLTVFNVPNVLYFIIGICLSLFFAFHISRKLILSHDDGRLGVIAQFTISRRY